MSAPTEYRVSIGQPCTRQNGVTVDAAGQAAWTLSAADNAVLGTAGEEAHIALFEWTGAAPGPASTSCSCSSAPWWGCHERECPKNRHKCPRRRTPLQRHGRKFCNVLQCHSVVLQRGPDEISGGFCVTGGISAGWRVVLAGVAPSPSPLPWGEGQGEGRGEGVGGI